MYDRKRIDTVTKEDTIDEIIAGIAFLLCAGLITFFCVIVISNAFSFWCIVTAAGILVIFGVTKLFGGIRRLWWL